MKPSTPHSLPTTLRRRLRRLCLLAGLAVLAAGGALPGPAQAQQQRASEQAQQRQPGGANLPAWARPGQSAPGAHSRQARPQREAPAAQPQQQPPDFGGDPAMAPIGGLEWLALAGGAYAVNRLRRRRDGEDAEESDEQP